MIAPYVITRADGTGEDRVTLAGPGIEPEGVPYVFANRARSELFIEAVNFAYAQGFAAGLRHAERNRQSPGGTDPRLVISGRTPESLHARPETRWERLRRRLRP